MVFILLIFFIVATSFVNEIGITSNYKDSASPNDQNQAPLSFDLSSNGQIFVAELTRWHRGSRTYRSHRQPKIKSLGFASGFSGSQSGSRNRSNGPGTLRWGPSSQVELGTAMKRYTENFDGLPGVESERLEGSQKVSVIFSLIISLTLFGLLPLSEFIRSDEWVVRKVEVPAFTPPPPPKTKMEKLIEKESVKVVALPKLNNESNLKLINQPTEVSLEVGPGDFKASFSLASFNPSPQGFSGEFVFELHELDRNPSILKEVNCDILPASKEGLEGEVKLLVQIDEKGKVKVLEVVSSTHPDFEDPSIEAAEGSIYEPPRRNGEAVKVQFFLPVRFSLLK